MKARKRWIVLAALAAFILLLILGAYPFFAVTHTNGSRVLVVEGWLGRGSLGTVAQLVREKGYERVFTTGIIRPASYYLKGNESLVAEFRQPVQGYLRTKLAGLPGSPVKLMADTEPIMITALGDPQEFNALISTPSTTVSIVDESEGGDPGVDHAFIGGWWIGDEDVQLIAESVFLVHADGSAERQGTTYAHLAAIRLEELGVPHEMITPVPTHRKVDRNTWSTAQDFVDLALRENISSFDVVTLGVHARRTRGLYRRAAQGGMDVGIIALPDPWCKPGSWWLHWYGWAKVMKEVFGASQPYTAD
jgi:hypothetical protein